MQLGQERRLPRQGQHPLLHHRALHIVILDHDVLLQDLHSIELVRAFSLREHDLGKRGSLSGWLEGPGAGGGEAMFTQIHSILCPDALCGHQVNG